MTVTNFGVCDFSDLAFTDWRFAALALVVFGAYGNYPFRYCLSLETLKTRSAGESDTKEKFRFASEKTYDYFVIIKMLASN